jgi:tetratricopeptide (TPR) repeat protein
MATSLEAFQAAFAHHQAGRLREAETIYRQILESDPNHANSLHLLGLVAHQRGEHDAAEQLITRAIALANDRAPFHTNLGEVYRAQGKLDKAEQSLRRALALEPDSARAQNNLGIVLAARGKPTEAIEAYRQAIDLDENFAEAHNNLGTVLQSTGELDQAIVHYRRAVAINPRYAAAHSNLGAALEIKRDFRAAAEAYRQALGHDPRHVNSLVSLGKILEDQGQPDEALACYDRAVAADPMFAQALVHRANVYKTLGRVRDAEAGYETALGIDPDNVEAHTNISLLQSELGQFSAALAHLDQAAQIQPESALVRNNRGMLLLLLGDFARGWGEYEWRWQAPGAGHRPAAGPGWDGGPLDGRTILLYPEQGSGDMLQFIRYAPLVKARGGRVIVGCAERMVPILSTCRGIEQFYSQTTTPPFDTHAALISLPGIFKTDLASIPADVPYLSAEPDRIERWRKRLRDDGRLRVGINWQGSTKYVLDHQRSMPLAQFGPLAQTEGVRLISLQKGEGVEQLADAPFPVEQLGEAVDQDAAFCDTAAVIKNLDLVITSDTAVAHLAGALGAPVWLALGLSPDWRWLLNRDDSPWYPTMRLFRQSQLGDWPGVFGRMAADLKPLAAQARSKG